MGLGLKSLRLEGYKAYAGDQIRARTTRRLTGCNGAVNPFSTRYMRPLRQFRDWGKS